MRCPAILPSSDLAAPGHLLPRGEKEDQGEKEKGRAPSTRQKRLQDLVEFRDRERT